MLRRHEGWLTTKRIILGLLVMAGAVIVLPEFALSGPGAQANAPISMVKLDPAFGTNGLATFDVAGRGPGGPNTDHEDEPYWVAQQPDGKIITAGKAFNPSRGNIDFLSTRHLPDGSPDPTFGLNGIVLTDFVGGEDQAMSVGVQADGKIVFGGFARRPGVANSEFALVRLNPNGSRDTSFGWNGRVMTDFFGLDDAIIGLAVLPDGKIVTAGYARRQAAGLDIAFARYNPNGSLDATFGIGGRATADFWGKDDSANKLAVQADGKLVAAGVATKPDGGSDFAVVRFNSNGTPDRTFGWASYVATDFLGGGEIGYSLLIQPDGKIVVGGLASNPTTGNPDLALARYMPNGALDATFGVFGKPGVLLMDFFGSYDQSLWLLLQPDDKILALGHAVHPTTLFDFAIARFNPDGNPDVTFGDNGRVHTDFFGGYDGSHAGILYSDGAVLMIGDAFNPATDSDDLAFARHLISDPSWVIGVLSKLSDDAFSIANQRTAMIASLQSVESSIAVGDGPSAVTTLQGLRDHVSGCGAEPDADDWVVACDDQTQIRALIDQIITKLQQP